MVGMSAEDREALMLKVKQEVTEVFDRRELRGLRICAERPLNRVVS